MAKIAKSDVVPGLLVATTRYREAVVVSGPNSRGMVRLEILDAGPHFGAVLSFPVQVLRWP